MPQALSGKNLLKGYNFRIEIQNGDSQAVAYASEVSAASAEYDIAEYRAGDDAHFAMRKYPGLARYSNVIIKQCLVQGEMNLYALVGDGLGGDANNTHSHVPTSDYKKEIVITLMDDAGNDTASWTLSEAWAVKYTMPELNSSTSEIAIETIEFAMDGFKRTK